MRVIAGELKGRRIDAPKGTTTRPTSDFVRETAFNLIGPVDGAVVIDLYAGSGALGHRGALPRRRELPLRRRLAATRAARSAPTWRSSACARPCSAPTSCGRSRGERGPFDLILADPPYEFTAYDRLAPHVARLLAPDGLAVVQTAAAVEPALEGLTVRTSRRYGSARLTLFEL